MVDYKEYVTISIKYTNKKNDLTAFKSILFIQGILWKVVRTVFWAPTSSGTEKVFFV